MQKEIAVFLGDDGQTISIYKSGLIKVYTKEQGTWKVLKEIPFIIDETDGIKSVRKSLTTMVQDLEKCKVFVGKEVTGLSYTVLEIAGFNIWEMEGKPEEFLDFVLEKEEEEELTENSEEKVVEVMVEPISPNKDGNYYINLNQLQNSKSGVTSKQALLPFLRNAVFYKLDIICSHLPLWLEGELERLCLKSDTEKTGANEYKVTVYSEKCKEC